jgi:hypothetical protein
MTHLAACERTIERGLASYIEVGRALIEIKTRKLYLEVAPTWGAYLRKRWSWSGTRAYQLMDAAKIAQLALSRGEDVPRSEGNARRRIAELRLFPDSRGRKPGSKRPPAIEPDDLTPTEIVSGLVQLYRAEVLREVARQLQERLERVRAITAPVSIQGLSTMGGNRR